MAPPINDPVVIPRVLAHYARAAPLLEASFSGSPIVFADFPRGLHGPPRFRVTHIPFSSARLGWLVQREYAIEFHSWAPLPGEPERLRFGRILLEPTGRAGFSRVKEGALALREHLLAADLDAIPLVDGVGGVALWLPFSEAPPANRVRTKLQRLCLRTAAAHRHVHIDTATNAAGRYSPLPYSLRGMPNLPVCSPVEWEELERLRTPVVCSAESFPVRLAERGDLFATAAASLAQQRLYPHTRKRVRKSLGA